ncbi:hypothetical protein F7725_022539 [Dissostichus mawsoni]|uniref:Uromodulin-like n=1 Tax=Dissostichus mawsoni TaxID=36200 RepID=A0A7J5YY13_DISMA|nr:hypothetical protein F7725_022539 [Dissostichus mawsoni]
MILIGLKLSVVLVLLLGCTHHLVQGTCSVEHCTDPTRCVLPKDQRNCKCATGYYGDQCDKDAHIKVMCGRDYITVRALEDFFMYHNVPLESLHLSNKSCRAQREVIHGVPYYMSRITKEKYLACGGKQLEKNFTHISYSLSLLSDPQVTGNIIRNPVIKIEYKCIYPYIRRVSLPFPLMLYTDQSYSKAYSSSPTIELRDKVYVEVTVTEPADFFLLRINKCWATQSSKPRSAEGLVHTLLMNGCVNDQTVVFLNESTGQPGRNGESSTVRFSFDMFRFTSTPHDLYLHCTVQLCEPDDHKTVNRSLREKRRTDDGGASCSRCLDGWLLPHHPHHRGQSRQQEACTN